MPSLSCLEAGHHACLIHRPTWLATYTWLDFDYLIHPGFLSFIPPVAPLPPHLPRLLLDIDSDDARFLALNPQVRAQIPSDHFPPSLITPQPRSHSLRSFASPLPLF